jgi:hypothetical protein
MLLRMPEEYEDNYTPDDLSIDTPKDQLIEEINQLRRDVNQLLKITGLTQMRLADWRERNNSNGI